VHDFSHVNDKYDVILVSNLYQLLNLMKDPAQRNFKKMLKTDGIIFLGTLSTRDPQHFGKGGR